MREDLMSQNILLIEDDLSYANRHFARRSLASATVPFQVEWVRHCIEGLERLVRSGRQEKHRPDGIAAGVGRPLSRRQPWHRHFLTGSFALPPRFRFWS